MKRIIKAAAYLGAVVAIDKCRKSYKELQRDKKIDASIVELQKKIRTSYTHIAS